MIYRICAIQAPNFIVFQNENEWDSSHVHDEWPKTSGVASKYYYDIILRAILGEKPPNISFVFEPMKGLGCYSSVRDNYSDFTIVKSGYHVQDFDKVNPVQVMTEGPLKILSTYKVDEYEIVYTDILSTSVCSFDATVWAAFVVAFLGFVVLLVLRKRANSCKRDKKQGNDLGDSPIFETFSHMISQDSSDFTDNFGKVISLTMTIGFFFIVVYYLNMMSTDLVVERKPPVIQNYRDIIDKKDLTVSFYDGLPDVKEFEDAEDGSIQAELWSEKKTLTKMMNPKNQELMMNIVMMVLKQKAVCLLDSLLAPPTRKMFCQMKPFLKETVPGGEHVYGWISSDPEGKQHTRGILMRHELKTPLIIKGLRRLKGLIEGDILSQGLEKGMDIKNDDKLSMFSDETSFYDTLKCLSKEVIYNSQKVDVVTLKNFRLLWQFVLIMFAFSYIVLIFERVKKRQQAKVILIKIEKQEKHLYRRCILCFKTSVTNCRQCFL